jgi:hypothetical protein
MGPSSGTEKPCGFAPIDQAPSGQDVPQGVEDLRIGLAPVLLIDLGGYHNILWREESRSVGNFKEVELCQ